MPKKSGLPLYFVEVQFQRVPSFYANLFAKVFGYLDQNDPRQEWFAVALFPTRAEEPTHCGPYEDLLASQRVKRIYLEDYLSQDDPPVGIGLLQLLFASVKKAQFLAPRLVHKANVDFSGSEIQAKVVELVERLLMVRFPGIGPEAIRMKFKLHDIRESKVWKEAAQEGREEGREEGLHEGDTNRLRQIVKTLLGKGKSIEEISELLDMPKAQVSAIAESTHGKKKKA
jgi:predicted transposase/invertase (TIGR01784 family)